MFEYIIYKYPKLPIIILIILVVIVIGLIIFFQSIYKFNIYILLSIFSIITVCSSLYIYRFYKSKDNLDKKIENLFSKESNLIKDYDIIIKQYNQINKLDPKLDNKLENIIQTIIKLNTEIYFIGDIDRMYDFYNIKDRSTSKLIFEELYNPIIKYLDEQNLYYKNLKDDTMKFDLYTQKKTNKRVIYDLRKSLLILNSSTTLLTPNNLSKIELFSNYLNTKNIHLTKFLMVDLMNGIEIVSDNIKKLLNTHKDNEDIKIIIEYVQNYFRDIKVILEYHISDIEKQIKKKVHTNKIFPSSSDKYISEDERILNIGDILLQYESLSKKINNKILMNN